jgi:hypothetical protein
MPAMESLKTSFFGMRPTAENREIKRLELRGSKGDWSKRFLFGGS